MASAFKHQLEQLEHRRVMAFDLVSAYAESATPFYVGGPNSVAAELNEAPQQITLKFGPGVKIEASTLSNNITIVRSGSAGDAFGNGNDVTIVPGSISVDDAPNQNQVVIRFAEVLPDDTYRITVGSGLGSSTNGNVAPTSFDFRLDLGAFVTAVVPQPVSRSSGGLIQARNQVDVYFNREDPLLASSAQNPSYYRIIEVDSTGADISAPLNPTAVSYDSATGKAQLTFGTTFDGTGLYRLEVGGGGSVAASAPVAETTESAGSVNSRFTTAQNLGVLSAVGATVNGEIRVMPTNATPAGDLLFPDQPGTLDEPGHRNTPGDSGAHGLSFATIDPATGITSINYNFKDDYGFDPQGNPLQNAITEAQKQRAREIFELYSLSTGIRFVETADQGITVVTGDMRALDPTVTTSPLGLASVGNVTSGLAIMDSTDNWGDSEYGGLWFRVAMHEIGHTLGLTHAYDVPCILGGDAPQNEPVFPGDYDALHLRELFQPNGTDVDLYRFTLTESGTLTAETVIARPGEVAASGLDSVLSLYREEVVDGRTVRTLIARNDNYYGRDSFVGLEVQAGTYFIAVTSIGNTDINPEVSDSGSGGRTDGIYQLRLGFTASPTASNTIVDISGKPIDGDRDGLTGGTFRFWFRTASDVDTAFVDKTAAAGGTGTRAQPYNTIAAAIANVGARRIIRIVGNATNTPYLVGTDLAGRPLADGVTFNVPQNVTVMIDAGAIIKLRAANIDVGSSSQLVSRAEAALQVLGTPDSKVHFTSYFDSLGGVPQGSTTAATAGQWGGVVFREDSDAASRRAFVNTINQASFMYGGGRVRVDSQLASFSPIQIESTRPTVAFNSITQSANAAIAATPNSFEDSNGRVGPDIRGNTLTGNTTNGLFVKIDTGFGRPLETLDVPARFKSTDIVYVLQENLVISGGAGGYLDNGSDVRARQSGRLAIDPGVIVKLQGARIELDRGISQLIAEGQPSSRVVFTSLGDNRFGAGGTFDTNGNLPDLVAAGDWGGIVLNAGSNASIDNAYLAFGGGSTPIEGRFDRFNVIEVHQGVLRLANSRIENNADGQATTNRTGRGGNDAATVFVRGAQPILVGNDFRANSGAVVSVNANSLSDVPHPDVGRSTGMIARYAQYDSNVGPLLAGNRLAYTSATAAVTGVVVRGEELTIESVWDDTDMVHVLQSEIIVNNLHTETGVRLQSRSDASLVVKLRGANAGFTAAGFPLDITDRVGGTVQIVGQPGYPVILSSLRDDSVGASLDPLGFTVKDTNNDGSASSAQAGDWRSLKFLPYSNDRNVAVYVEAERPLTDGLGSNDAVPVAESLGVLAPNFATGSNSWASAQEKSGDENRRLGFEVHGIVAPDTPGDVDVYRFAGYAGSEVWIDIDKTSGSLDSMVELLDAAGTVLARSVDSVLEGAVVKGATVVGTTAGVSATYQLPPGGVTPGTLAGVVYDTSNPLVGPVAIHTFTVAADGTISFHDVLGTDRLGNPLGAPAASNAAAFDGIFDAVTGLLTLDFSDTIAATSVEVRYAYTTPTLAAVAGAALPLAKDAWQGNDFYSLNPKNAGMRVILPGVQGTQQKYFIRVRSQPRYESTSTEAANGGVTATTLNDYRRDLADSALVGAGASSGHYELRVRLRQQDDKPGSTVRYADIRYPQIGLDVQGLPNNSHLTGEAGETAADNGSFANAQYVGNLLQTDHAAISVAGNADGEGDVDWYAFDVDVAKAQSGGGAWATMFDIDYGDGFRGDLTLSVFDATGKLIYVGRDSNIADDQPGNGQGSDFDDLSRGSVGKLDPYIGTVALPAGSTGTPVSGSSVRYYVAVSSNERLPSAINATYRDAATNSLIRLEPVSSVAKVVEDRIGTATSKAVIDATNQFTLSSYVTPFTLSDVTLFVSGASSLATVDAMRGGVETTIVGYYGNATSIGDLIMRADGSLWAYAGVRNLANTAGRLDRVDPGTGARTTIGNDNIPNRDPNAGTPATATQTDVSPQGTGASTTTTFILAQKNVSAATANGSLELTGSFGGTTGSATWTFSGAVGGGITFNAVSKPTTFPTPLSGTINEVQGTITIVWSAQVPRSGVKLGSVDYTYTTTPPSPEDVTTDTVDAIAWQRTGVGDFNDLYFSVRDGGVSRLYRANPANGDAKVTQNQPWGYKGYIQDAGGSLGVVGGMAYLGGALYGVDSNGYFFTINVGTGAATLIDLDPTTPGADPLGVEFRGLAIGPQNLAAGAYANLLFTIDAAGDLRAFNTAGELQPIFDQDGDGLAGDTSVASGFGAPTGLAFSPLDVNLWHPTTRRGGEAGHGLNVTPDSTRTVGTQGGSSMYFGFEQYQAANPTYGGFAPVNGQYGAVSTTWQQDLSSNPYTAMGNTYNLPGGAYGSLTTRAFSLEAYEYTDKPTLYFNYWLDTQNASSRTNGMRDSARVFVSIDGGFTWELVATNNQLRSTAGTVDAELPVTATASSRITSFANQKVQELFDSGSWRQARVDLGDYAGQADIRLRFDFSTAGEVDTADTWRTSAAVTTGVAADVTVPLADVSNLFAGLTMVSLDGTVLGTVVAVDPDTNTVEIDAPVTLAANGIVTFVDTTGGLLNNIAGLAGTTGDFGSATRGQSNDYEGFYIDDVIVGFAERGEMVTAANASETTFFDTATSGAASQVLQGPYQLEIRRGTEYFSQSSTPRAILQTFDTNDPLVAAASTTAIYGPKVGDQNVQRQQGQFIIENNIVSDAATYGISIDAGARDANSNVPHPGAPRNLPVLSYSRLVPGVVVANNVISTSGTAGILFSGDPNTGAVPTAAVPFGRIVNNTIYGGPSAQGVGVSVTENAGPTLINNLFVNLDTGVNVDSTSRTDSAGNQRTVVATSAYANVATGVSGVVQNQALALTGDPFVNAAGRNFYLVAGSAAIDSALNSLQDRYEFLVVNSPLGIGASPILAPDSDLYGQLRGDDPLQASSPGLGSNVFKDRGAIDRVDTTKPYATLAAPLDGGPLDRDTGTADSVVLSGRDAKGVTQFVLQLKDLGAGIDKATVTAGGFSLTHDGVLLAQGTDYIFRYLDSSNRVVFLSPSVFKDGRYVIGVKNQDTDVEKPTDLAGNTMLPNQADGSLAFTVALYEKPVINDITDDVSPVIGILAPGVFTNDASLLIAGRAEPGTNVTVVTSAGGTVFGPVTADANGYWSITTLPLAEGFHEFRAYSTDAEGGVSEPSLPYALTVDTTRPGIPVIDSVTDDIPAVTGPISSGGSTNDAMPEFTGSAEPGSTIYLQSGSLTLGPAIVDSSGHWSYTPSTLDNGLYTFTAISVDKAGNSSAPSLPFAVTVDTSTPVAPVIFGVDDDVSPVTGSVPDGGSTNDDRFTIFGTAEPGVVITVRTATETLGTTLADASGMWSLPTGLLVDGTYTIVAVAADAAANTSTESLPYTVTVDTIAPAVPTIAAGYDDQPGVIGTLLDGAVTNDSSPLLSGTGEPGSRIVVTTAGGSYGPCTVDQLGRWSLVTGPLADGTYVFRAHAVDAAGNTSSPSLTFTLSIDTQSPPSPQITAVSDDAEPTLELVPPGGRTNDRTLRISGIAAAGLSITVRAGALTFGPVVADASGLWSLTTSALADGTYSLSATAANAIGNTSKPSDSYVVGIDTVAPSMPVISSVYDDVQLFIGSIANGGRTNDRMLLVSGRAEPFATVVVKSATRVVGQATADAAGQWSLTTDTLADGGQSLTAQAVDAAGNTSATTATFFVTVDATPPNAPAIARVYDDVAPVIGDVVSGSGTNDRTLLFSGTCEPGATITLRTSLATFGPVKSDLNGRWSLTTSALADGTYTFTAIAVDATGNTSGESAPFPVTVDTVAPITPTITSVYDDIAPGIGVIPSGGVTNDNMPEVSGTAEPGAQVTVWSNFGTSSAQSQVVTADGSGTWRLISREVRNGVTSFTATAQDSGGNRSGFSIPYAVTVDTVAPQAPTITSIVSDVPPGVGTVPNGGFTNDGLLQVNGTAEPSSRVTFWTNYGLTNAVAKIVIADSVGRWSVSTNQLADGAYTFSAIARDAATNKSPLSALSSVTVDTVAPRISQVVTPVASATYGIGQVIPIHVRFTESVQVSGTPSLALNTVPARTASLVSVLGQVMTFNYTVQVGDSAALLDYVSTSSLSLNGGTIRDLAGNPAVSTLAAPGTPGSLSSTKAIRIDAAIRVVAQGLSDTAATAIGYANPLRTIPITFNTPVTGVTISSLRLFFEDRSLSLAGATLTGSGTTYALSLPATTTSLKGTYRLRIGGPASGIKAGAVLMNVPSNLYWKHV